MKVTIKDIAKMAGVSPGTVSKIINNYQDVGIETRKKVLKIMEETGYIANRSMKDSSRKTSLIAVIYAGKVNADFNHPFFREVMNSFKNTIGTLGYDLLFFTNETFENSEEDYYTRCLRYNVDGVLILSGEDVEPSISELDISDIPCIGVDIQLKGEKSAYIMSDNFQISAKAVEHFYLNGYRKIAYIGGLEGARVSELREEGFISKIEEFGLSINRDWMTNGDFFEKSGYEAMQKILNTSNRPEAVFATSDLMAFGAMKAIKENGLKIPEDIAIIGCDDIDACNYTDPPLTSVYQDKVKIGRLAANMLNDMIKKHAYPKSVMVEPKLIVRKSCGMKK